MNIRLSGLMPHPLAEQDTSTSEVWGADALRFSSGEFSLVGSASGKGKSTLLGIIFGLRKDYEGEVLVGDRKPESLSLAEWAIWRQSKLSMVFQGLRLFANLNGWDNLEAKNKLTNFRTKEELADMVSRLGISDLMERPCGTWSFGQRQRLAIVRALAQPFQWLLLDEPFSHLDDENARIAAAMITEACRAQQAGLILTSLGDDYGLPFDHNISL